MQLIERTKLCHWIFISIFLVDPSHFAAIRRDGRSVTAVCALCKKSVFFFSRWIWGWGLIQPIATFANRKSTSNHHPTVAGWPAGWKRWLADCAITGDIQWVAIELMWTFVPEPSDLIEILCPSDVICSHGALTDVGGGKPQPHYKVSFQCHQTWEIPMKTVFCW